MVITLSHSDRNVISYVCFQQCMLQQTKERAKYRPYTANEGRGKWSEIPGI
jgi:hypothetical protein